MIFTKALAVFVPLVLIGGARAEQSQECGRAPPIDLTINRDGSIDFEQHHLTSRSEMSRKLSDLGMLRPQPQIRILPDHQAKYDTIAAVLTVAQRAGLHCIGFTGIEQ